MTSHNTEVGQASEEDAKIISKRKTLKSASRFKDKVVFEKGKAILIAHFFILEARGLLSRMNRGCPIWI